MDDLKLYVTDKNQLLSLLETTAIFSTNIQMNFDIQKCATLEVKKGKIVANKFQSKSHSANNTNS
jgi:hypothetical protein